MSRTRSGSRSTPTGPSSSEAPRPIALLMAVAVATSLSTWYWYRPLPKRADDSRRGPFDSRLGSATDTELPRPKSSWKDAGLIFPSEEETDSGAGVYAKGEGARPSVPMGELSNPTLTGSSDLALKPFRESKQPLQESLADSSLPMVPVLGTDAVRGSPLPKPKLWADPPKEFPSHALPDASSGPSLLTAIPSNEQGFQADAASPFRVPKQAASPRSQQTQEPSLAMQNDIWPDQGFQPHRHSGAPDNSKLAKQGTPNPGRSEAVLSSSTHRIRTLDGDNDPVMVAPATNLDGTATSGQTGPSPSLPSGGKRLSPRRTPSPAEVIRQPSAKGAGGD